jgi:hypothetical protein
LPGGAGDAKARVIVIAVDRPVRDQPVACAIGDRKTGRENIDPMATQPIGPPAAAMITVRHAHCCVHVGCVSALYSS